MSRLIDGDTGEMALDVGDHDPVRAERDGGEERKPSLAAVSLLLFETLTNLGSCPSTHLPFSRSPVVLVWLTGCMGAFIPDSGSSPVPHLNHLAQRKWNIQPLRRQACDVFADEISRWHHHSAVWVLAGRVAATFASLRGQSPADARKPTHVWVELHGVPALRGTGDRTKVRPFSRKFAECGRCSVRA
jgi:hypothetical protein